mmetsp:Transcript_10961/g.17195  ORF Transcript_10961/g.17195 Transcript_10961/m.17195 type:complete len:109 (-) Transcript_10961:53-379(-)
MLALGFVQLMQPPSTSGAMRRLAWMTPGPILLLVFWHWTSSRVSDRLIFPTVTISCKQTNLGDELSLFYIRRTLWKYEEDADLVLHYFRNKEYDIEYFDDEEEDNDES